MKNVSPSTKDEDRGKMAEEMSIKLSISIFATFFFCHAFAIDLFIIVREIIIDQRTEKKKIVTKFV